MIRNFIAAACAAFLVVASQGPASAEGPRELPERIDWAITPSGNDSDDQVQLTLSYRSGRGHSNWSNSTRLSELQGLDPAQLASDDGSQVRFQIVRDAGRFDCDGIVRRERGTGECRFQPDAAFAAALAERGIERPTEAQHFQLALARVGLDLVDELERHNYPRPGIDDLVRAGIHGVSADYVRGMTEAGYHVGAAEGLVEMRIHGVTPDYVRSLAEAGYRPETETLKRLAIHGVTTDYIREMGAAGYRELSADDLVELRIHGVTPAFVRALAAAGYRPGAEMIKRLAIHGVTADYLRDMAELGYRDLSPEDLVGLRIHGVTTDYVRELRSLGYERLSADELRRMRIHGVTASFVRNRIRAGARLSPDELVRLRIHGG